MDRDEFFDKMCALVFQSRLPLETVVEEFLYVVIGKAYTDDIHPNLIRMYLNSELEKALIKYSKVKSKEKDG